MRLIDADALYEFIKDQMEKETGAYTRGKNKAFNIVKSALHNECATPTIDAAPVCRCKDCKEGEVDDPDFPDQYYCHAGCGWNKEDFFCAYGERKGG